jgi:hypothetical protein
MFVDRAKNNFTPPPRIKRISSLTGSTRAAVGQPVAPNMHGAAFHVHAIANVAFMLSSSLLYLRYPRSLLAATVFE